MISFKKFFQSIKFIQREKLFVIIISSFLFLNLSKIVLAQSPTVVSKASDTSGAATLGVAHIVEIKDKDVKDGSIISAGEKGATLSSLAYDPQVLGVVARDAAIILNTSSTNNGVPLISTGTVYVLVSSKEGNIKKNDLITTSIIPGVGVKATNAGYVLGTAMEDYNNPNTKQSDKIAVNLDLHYFNSKPTFPGTLSDILKIVILPTKEGPSAIFKYMVAGFVVLGSLVLGFVSFGRTAAKGVEALGRNPSASKIINLGIVFNVTIVVAIALAGLIVAFLILRL